MPGRKGLIPYSIMVYPKEGKPYQTTRWRKPSEQGGTIHIIPAASYMGNLHEVYQAWKSFVSHIDEVTDSLLQPIVALQEIIMQGRAGLLAVEGNRVIGVAALQKGKDFLSASPADQLQGRQKEIIETLEEGLAVYEMVE